MRGWLNRPGTNWWRGQNGVRAGYRVLVFIAVYILVGILLAVLLHGLAHFLIHDHAGVSQAALAHHSTSPSASHLHPKKRHMRLPMWLSECLAILVVLIATKIMTWLEDRSLWSCYLTARKRVGPLLIGLACGIAALAVLIGLLLVTGHAHIGFPQADWGVILRNCLFGLILALLIGFNEELTFRGYIQQTLNSRLGFWLALVLTSALFCVAHLGNPNENFIGIASVFGAGVVLCIGLRQTGALWWSIGFHAGWDFSEDYLFGTHDSGITMHGALLNTVPHGATWLSGGMVGPEGSIFSLLVELIAAILLLTLWRRPDAEKAGV